MLTARGDETDRIVGLELGADDYLPKPFEPRELLARIRSLLRRQATTKETVLEHRGIRVDLLANPMAVRSIWTVALAYFGIAFLAASASAPQARISSSIHCS